MIENVSRKQPSRVYFLIVLALSIVLLVLAFRGVDWNAMFQTARQAQPEYIILAIVILTVSYFFRAVRWRILLRAERPIPLLTVFWATNIGYLGNSFLPARAGELIRSVLIGRSAGISNSYVLATALSERILDAFALLIFSFLSIPFVGPLPAPLVTAVKLLTIASVVGVGGLLLAPRFQRLIFAVLDHLPIPEKIAPQLRGLIEQFLLGMRAFQNFSAAAQFLVWTVVIWLIDIGLAISVAHAFGLTLQVPQAFLLLAALGLSSAIPSTPGYIGVYQFVAVTVLVPFGFTQDQALVYIIVFQLVTYIVVIVWGILGLWRLGLSPTALPVVSKQSEQPLTDGAAERDNAP